MTETRVALDVMGGDQGAAVTMEAAAAVSKDTSIDLLLVGDPDATADHRRTGPRPLQEAQPKWSHLCPDEPRAVLGSVVCPGASAGCPHRLVLRRSCPRHALRARVVPTPEATSIPPKQLSLFVPQGQLELTANTGPALDKQLLDVAPRRLSWMSLLARVFRFDVSVWQRCQGPMRVARAVSSPDEIAEALDAARPPPRPSPRGQLMLFLA
ncbi:MAG: hypothetical protein ACRBN8_19155 [Nannocystales bacterium]